MCIRSIDVSFYMPSSLFIQTLVEVHRNKSRKHCLFFPLFISRILAYLELEDFPSSNYVHLIAPMGSFFLKQWNAQKKTVEPSVGLLKRSRVESIAKDVHAKEIPFDPTVAVADDDDVDEVDVDTTNVEPTIPPSLSLRDMMETFMMTQTAHGQLLGELITKVATLRANFHLSI